MCSGGVSGMALRTSHAVRPAAAAARPTVLPTRRRRTRSRARAARGRRRVGGEPGGGVAPVLRDGGERRWPAASRPASAGPATPVTASPTTPTTGGGHQPRRPVGRRRRAGGRARPARWATARASGSRSTGSNLWTLRSGARPPSSACLQRAGATVPSTGPVCACGEQHEPGQRTERQPASGPAGRAASSASRPAAARTSVAATGMPSCTSAHAGRPLGPSGDAEHGQPLRGAAQHVRAARPGRW